MSDGKHIIAVDFDGTIVDHMFPDIGAPVPGAIECMKLLNRMKVNLMLWTMRSDDRPGEPRQLLTEAADYCRSRGVELWGVNSNPQQAGWTGSPKQYAHLYIDDAAVGVPLLHASFEGKQSERPVVDWYRAMPIVFDRLGLWAAFYSLHGRIDPVSKELVRMNLSTIP